MNTRKKALKNILILIVLFIIASYVFSVFISKTTLGISYELWDKFLIGGTQIWIILILINLYKLTVGDYFKKKSVSKKEESKIIKGESKSNDFNEKTNSAVSYDNHKVESSGGYINSISEYISKRKKNVVLFLIIGLINKVFIHYFLFREIGYNSGIKFKVGNGVSETKKGFYNRDLAYHINNVFTDEIILFIPAFLILGFIVWYFNDKIKAK